MIERYRHTQKGYVMIFSLGSALIFNITGMLILFTSGDFEWHAAVVLVLIFIILSIVLALFSTLTVIIREDSLEARFGPGIIRKKISLKDIESCKQVKNLWYYGWGIRYTPHGWLYNVSGLDAVEIKLKSGKKYRIGTDVPLELENAILQSIRISSF